MTEFERRFLIALSNEPKGRVAYRLAEYSRLMENMGDLVTEGFITERRLGAYPGFQITQKGRQYLGGLA
jgi:predicted transcriptional regulator